MAVEGSRGKHSMGRNYKKLENIPNNLRHFKVHPNNFKATKGRILLFVLLENGI